MVPQVVLQFLVPSLLILILNLRILRKIQTLRSNVYRQSVIASSSSSTDSVTRNSRRQRHKTTCMLLIVSFTYVITLFPLVLVSLILHGAVLTNPELAGQIYTNMGNVVRFLELFSEINYASNFYIYVLSGVQFRYALRHICSRRHFFTTASSGQPQPHTERVFYFRKFASNS